MVAAEIIYEPVDAGFADPAIALATARIFGCGQKVGDVLDLGSGTGVILEAAAKVATGRLVGIDISEAACGRARSRLAGCGDRAEILATDLINVSPAALGSFDLIYCIGTYYCVAPHVQAHILELVRTCLRPGGVAVLSYYAGAMHTLRAQQHGMARAACQVTEPVQQVAFGRSFLSQLAASLDGENPAHRLALDGLNITLASDDVRLLHEVFNPSFGSAVTSDLERALAPAGVQFLDYVRAPNFSLLDTSAGRARAADQLDSARGSYWHAIFGRPHNDAGVDPASAGVAWWTPLYRNPGSPDGYVTRAGEAVQVRSATTRRLLDALSWKTLSWGEIVEAANDVTAADLDQAKRDFLQLWRMGLLTPTARFG